MQRSLRAIVVPGCASIVPQWLGFAAAPMPIGNTGASRYPRSATSGRACWRWDWRRARMAPTAPGGMFTGDGSGDFLFPVLHEAGFASQPNAVSRNDGMKLTDLWISAVVRCAPPANKPTPEEQRNCASWLDEEMSLLKNLRVVVCLGRIAFDGLLAHAQRTGTLPARSGFVFAHGAEYTLPGGLTSSPAIIPRFKTPTPASSPGPCFLPSSSGRENWRDCNEGGCRDRTSHEWRNDGQPGEGDSEGRGLEEIAPRTRSVHLWIIGRRPSCWSGLHI